MLKILGRLGDLLRVVDVLDDVIGIALRFKTYEALIRDAPVGSVVNCGMVKGIKMGGRRLDLPLDPIVRE